MGLTGEWSPVGVVAAWFAFRAPCPACRKLISKRATRCPRCTTELE